MRTKLTIMLLAIALGTMLAVSSIAWFTTESILREDVFRRMVSVREEKSNEIETYFETLRNKMQLLTQDETVIEAMQEFSEAYDALADVEVSAEQRSAINDFYESEFLPVLEANMRENLSADAYVPQDPAASYLQYQYLVDNPNPVGEKQLLDRADDDTLYSDVHGHYHPFLRTFLGLFRYYDLFLIDADSRDVVYSVFKEVDLGSSLVDGPYATSGLAQVVDRVLQNPDSERIDVIDFLPYDPSYQAPAAFWGTPLYDQSELVGVLVIQAPVDEIDAVMTSGRNWAERGLGESGKTYLVGADHLMRSTSRFLVEDKIGYLQALRQAGVDELTLNRIANLDTSILQQEVRTDSTDLAIAGQEGIHIINDYRNIPVLSAYAPLEIEGLSWAIMAEIDVAEITAPIRAQQRQFLIGAGILSLILAAVSYVAAGVLTRPLRQLITGLNNVGEGELETLPPTRANDEVGQLVTTYNEMVHSLRQQRQALQEQIRANDRLLLSILPDPIAARFKEGERNIAEPVTDVTILFAHLRGVQELAYQMDDDKALIELINDLSARLDDAANELDVVRQPTVSNRYVFACGLSHTPPDHTERVVLFALKMRGIIDEFNDEYRTQLAAQIGIHTGNVLASILETHKFRFDLWGQTISIADAIETSAQPNTILLSHEAYIKARLAHSFVERDPVILENGTSWRVWELLPPSYGDDSAASLNQMVEQIGGVTSLPTTTRSRRLRPWRRFTHS